MSNSYLSQFTFVGRGIWKQETYGMSIMLNEDYNRTYRAYHWDRPLWRFVAKNKNGNPIRFRSAEAAARHLFKGGLS